MPGAFALSGDRFEEQHEHDQQADQEREQIEEEARHGDQETRLLAGTALVTLLRCQ